MEDPVPPVPYVSLRDYIEERLTEVERSVAREVAVLRVLMAEHADAHAREHVMAQTAIDRAYDETQKQFVEERTFLMHHSEMVQRAVDKAEATINTRLEGMNEFREALTNQSAEMARREYVDTVMNTINARLDEKVEATLMAGAERARVTNARLDGIDAGITRRLDELRESVANQGNKWSNLEGRMYMITAIMTFIIFVVTIVGFVMRELAR